MSKKIRPFLKYLGNKYRLVEQIRQILPERQALIECCVGSGAVFLGTDYERYVLNDADPDLIDLYRFIQADPECFVSEAKRLFTRRNNTETAYYRLRSQFNQTRDRFEKAQLYLYLNRHSYNAIMRRNRSGDYNTPFGWFHKPYFPEEEIYLFAEKSQRATFVCGNFSAIFSRARKHSALYADPPFVPKSSTANFTSYIASGFDLTKHEHLARLARGAAERGVPVLISNHDTPVTRRLYQGAKRKYILVPRSISCKGDNRKPAKEVLAYFPPVME
jgi:DNA adenine methylase